MPLKNAQYNAILREYDRLQAENARALSAKKTALYQKHPDLLTLHRKLTENAAARARAGITGDAVQLAVLKEEAASLKREKAAYMEAHGIPENILEPAYRCPDCQDTGFIGKEKCHCFLQRAVDLLYDQSNIRDILQKENFDNLSLDYYNKTAPEGKLSQYDYMKSRIALCHDFVDYFDDGPDNLLFYGPTGVGKTFLSHCIAKALIDSCHSVVYFSAIDLFEQFSKTSFNYDEDSQEQLDQYILESDLLIIDDLGTERVNAFTNGKLFYCINERIARRKSTIISTNLDPNTLADAYTERVASRILSNFTMIHLTGEDIRIKQKFGV